MDWKLPPPEKIYEAYSVLADERYLLKNPGQFQITSSSGDKSYVVRYHVDEDNISIISDDNGSRWQGYTGYPIIAVLMITGKIIFNHNILPYFKEIPWNKLNKLHKNNYKEVVDLILNQLEKTESDNIREETDKVFQQLSQLKLQRLNARK